MNTLSSSSICVFLRISDLTLSFSSSSCFFCFKVWEKNRTEHCQLTNNAVKSTTRKFFFNQMQSENHSWSIWFRQHSLRPPPVTCFPWSFDWFPMNNGDCSFEIGSRDFSDPALNLATGHTFLSRVLIDLLCQFHAHCLALWNGTREFSRAFRRLDFLPPLHVHFTSRYAAWTLWQVCL